MYKRQENEVIVTRPSDDPVHRSLHGLTRTLVSNMVTGCHETFKKELEVNGVGYRVAKQGKNLVMNLGFSHQVIMAAGTFVSGASIELSADAPMRPPYIAYWQGGLTYAHCRHAVGEALRAVCGVK